MKRCFIEYLNATKGFQKDIAWFEGEDAEVQAKEWGMANLENFSIDMIRFSSDETITREDG